MWPMCTGLKLPPSMPIVSIWLNGEKSVRCQSLHTPSTHFSCCANAIPNAVSSLSSAATTGASSTNGGRATAFVLGSVEVHVEFAEECCGGTQYGVVFLLFQGRGHGSVVVAVLVGLVAADVADIYQQMFDMAYTLRDAPDQALPMVVDDIKFRFSDFLSQKICDSLRILNQLYRRKAL